MTRPQSINLFVYTRKDVSMYDADELIDRIRELENVTKGLGAERLEDELSCYMSDDSDHVYLSSDHREGSVISLSSMCDGCEEKMEVDIYLSHIDLGKFINGLLYYYNGLDNHNE